MEWARRYRNVSLAIVATSTLAEGFNMESDAGLGATLAYLITASGIALWCTLDAQLHNKLFLRSFAWIMMYIWPVGLLAHLVWTRRSRGVLVYGLAAALWLLVYLIGALGHEALEYL